MKFPKVDDIYIFLTDRTHSRCEWGVVVFCHRMAHCVLIRCFPQPSLAEALCLYNFFCVKTDRTHSDVRTLTIYLSHGGAQCAYPEFIIAESLLLPLKMLPFYSLYGIFLYERTVSKSYAHSFVARLFRNLIRCNDIHGFGC